MPRPLPEPLGKQEQIAEKTQTMPTRCSADHSLRSSDTLEMTMDRLCCAFGGKLWAHIGAK